MKGIELPRHYHRLAFLKVFRKNCNLGIIIEYKLKGLGIIIERNGNDLGM